MKMGLGKAELHRFRASFENGAEGLLCDQGVIRA